VKVIQLHKENALLPNQKLQDDVFHLIKASFMFHIFEPVEHFYNSKQSLMVSKNMMEKYRLHISLLGVADFMKKCC